MKNLIYTIFLIASAFFCTSIHSQTVLKMGTTGGPAGTGPLTTAQVVTLTDAGTGSAYSPSVNVTYTISNQQFGAGTIEGLPTNLGSSFGGNLTSGANSPMSAFNLYSLMNGISSPTNALFTGCKNCAVGTGIDVTTDRSISLFNCTDALINSNSANLQALNARVYFADLTISFNRPVSNPILQFVGMGGTTTFTSGTTKYDMGFATEFDLVGTNVAISKLSGNAYLSVSSTQITNNATYIGASSVGTASNGITRYAASGSILATGTNITSITFKMYVRGDGGRINNGTSVVAAGTANGNTLYPTWALGASNPWAFAVPAFTNVSGDVMLFGVSFQKPVTVSGNVFNDPDGGNVNNSTGSANTIPSGVYANLMDANGKVVASTSVNTDGTYSFPAIFEGDYAVNISTSNGVQGFAAPVTIAPTDWTFTGEFNGAPNTGNDGTINGTSAIFTVAASDITNVNFGIEKLPIPTSNIIVTQNNPGGTQNVTVPASSFSTIESHGGTVTSIRITSFPSNITSITINGTLYTSATFPVGGVVIPTNALGQPTQAISIDPVDGLIDVVIPYKATDNAGLESVASGNVTMSFISILSSKYLSFTANKQNNISILNFSIAQQAIGSVYSIERSVTGTNFTAIGTITGTTATNYTYIDVSPIQNAKNYYRIKEVDARGIISYSDIRMVKYTNDIKVEVYPIPAVSNINITLNDALVNKAIIITLYNAQGQEVKRKQINQASATETLNVSNIACGTYQLQITNNNEIVAKRNVMIVK